MYLFILKISYTFYYNIRKMYKCFQLLIKNRYILSIVLYYMLVLIIVTYNDICVCS